MAREHEALISLLAETRAACDAAVSLARELETALAREREANRAKDEFLAMLGHELRHPLAPILGIVELRRARALGELSREDAMMERQARHLARLVDDLLDVSRISSGKLAIQREHVCLAEVIEGAIEMARPLIDAREHVLITMLAPDLWLDADGPRLAQVVANVLSNAAKYTPPRGRLSVTARREDDRAVLTVSDDGPGLPSTLLAHVFEPFVQGARAYDRADGGLGLGLAIVKTIVELHGGTVCALSDGAGHGTEVVIELPLGPPAEGAVTFVRAARPSQLPRP